MIYKLLLVIATLIQSARSQPPFLNIFAAIQNTQQNYFSYLPFISSCNYTASNFIKGNIQITPLQQYQIFNKIQQDGQDLFWGPVMYGFDIEMMLPSSIQGYDGYILFNSQIRTMNRQIILYNINDSGLIFNYATVNINPQNLLINFTIQNVIIVDLSQQALIILKECDSISQNFSYIGNNTFLYACGSLQAGFTFIPGKNSSYVNKISFQQVGVGSYQLAVNPSLISRLGKQIILEWSCALLCTNSSGGYLFFIIFEENNVTISSLASYHNQTVILIDRVWGQQIRFQTTRWMDLYSTINIQLGNNFPGDVVSVYISQKQNIFIESITPEGLSYLIVFDDRGTIYWNISFYGSVVYYGSQVTFIYNESSATTYSVSVTRPIYVIDPSIFGTTTPGQFSYLQLTIPCHDVNITVNYDIFWTTIQYPIYMVYSLNNNPINTTDSTYAQIVNERFLMIGPEIRVVPDSPAGIQVQIIQSQSVTINNRALGIISFWEYPPGAYGIIVATNTTIYYIGPQSKLLTLVINPCGFKQIKSAQVDQNGNYLITNPQGQTCLCQQDFSYCTKNNVNQTNLYQKGTNNGQLETISPPGQTNIYGDVLIRKNLFELYRRGYVISILQNNSVVLYNVNKNNPQYMVDINCTNQNSVNGIIFQKGFYNPSVFVFCAGASTMDQYMISPFNLTFQRTIPLYGFTTRSQLKSILYTGDFLFLAVDPLNMFYPMPRSCCILRINPIYPTVSVIRDIINASNIIATATDNNLNFAVMQIINQYGYYETVVKIFLPHRWLSCNLTSSSQITIQETVQMNFVSIVYNFNTYLYLNVQFNLTTVNLNLTQVTNTSNGSVIVLNISQQNYLDSSVYNVVINYNMGDYVCGPVFQSFFARSNSSDKNVQITQSTILTKSKVIGGSKISFLQIINPQNWNQANCSYNNLLLFVCEDIIMVYAKYQNGQEMVLIDNITLPTQQCTYYPYTYINQTSVQLMSDCLSIKNLTFQNPILTINYNPNNTINPITYSYFMIRTPLSLRNIHTIVIGPNNTVVIGVLEGPMYTETGRLVICDSSFNCSSLYVSTDYSFLVDYSSYETNIGQPYYVMTIDPLIIAVFISPTVQYQTTRTTPNYTFAYLRYVDEPYCSTLKLLTCNSTFAYIILSCQSYYYLITMNFTTNLMNIITRFSRYSQCALFDDFKPSYIFRNNKLEVFYAQCRQNDYILKLNAFDGIKSNSNPIYTGYMQIFVMEGPQGPNCSNFSISPIKVIPVSTSMDRPLYMSYTMGTNGGVLKFLYSQINGIIIDNVVQISPHVQIKFQPTQKKFQFPQIMFYVTNQFHTQSLTIMAKEKTIMINYTLMNIIIFILFAFANMITLCVIVLYLNRNKNIHLKKQDNQDDNQLELTYHQDIIKVINNNNNREQRQKSITRRNASLKMNQIEMFFVKSPSNL